MTLLLRTDVTAVKLFENFILAGIGSYVKLFEKETNVLLKTKELLKGQKVYGFVPTNDHNKILVFGGKQFIVISLSRVNDGEIDIAELCDVVACDDWLHTGIWINLHEVAVLTAHNVVQVWDVMKQCLVSKHYGRNNSILYSGLLLPLNEDILVFAGTVFSELIIHSYKIEEPLHSLKGHRGVIFSIACDAEKEIIVTTSDDRSVRIWSPNSNVDIPRGTRKYWENVDIVCKHEVYGHLARVMRCIVTANVIVSVGEDAAICYWDINGELLKKILSHQNGNIWCVDADGEDLVTGGGDGGVVVHPLTITSEYGTHDTLPLPDNTAARKLVFTSKGNLVVLCENDELIYYDLDSNNAKVICKLKHDSTYKLLSISSCKQIISVTDMFGNLNIFIENCKIDVGLEIILNCKLDIGKILSMHWTGNRHLVFCCDNGNITVLAANGSQINSYADFILPSCKERWLTATAYEPHSKTFALGDRCGNIHIYNPNKKDPIKTFRKVHGRYGPTSITFRNNEIVTTGRDGAIKYFSFGNRIVQMDGVDLNFQWVEKFLDKSQNVVCGFQERVFVVYDIKNRATLLEVSCGGGHRSWDAHRHFIKKIKGFEEHITMVYIKNSIIHKSTFQLNKIISRNVIKGSHVKEINCLKAYRSHLDNNITFLISGGEDTTLRVTSCRLDQDTYQDELILKQLSNIRCLQVCELNDDEVLLVAAGGRARVCVKKLIFSKENDAIRVQSESLIDYLIKGSDKERKCNRNWRDGAVDFDPETRIMGVDVVRVDPDTFVIFAGCSDALIRIFRFTHKENGGSAFELTHSVAYHATCILKTEIFKYRNRNILATTTTTGELALWDSIESRLDDPPIRPMFATRVHKSGVNGLSVVSDDDCIRIATGGDDNAVHLVSLVEDADGLRVDRRWSTDRLHCALVCAVRLLGGYLVSVSVEQRAALSARAGGGGGGLWALSQTFVDVADAHGMDVVEHSSDSVTICVYGKGVQVVEIPTPR